MHNNLYSYGSIDLDKKKNIFQTFIYLFVPENLWNDQTNFCGTFIGLVDDIRRWWYKIDLVDDIRSYIGYFFRLASPRGITHLWSMYNNNSG